MTGLFLTDAEVDAMCDGPGANSHAAKCKRLRNMGLIVNRKPNGRPLVVRSHAEAVLSGRSQIEADAGQAQETRPTTGDRAAIVALFGRKRAA